MDGIDTVKKSLLVFLVLALNVSMVWSGVEVASLGWYVLLVADVVCAGWMAYSIIRVVHVWMKKKLSERAEHKVKRVRYRRMAM